MAAKIMKYTLNDFNEIIFNGFNYELSSDIVSVISNLALEVGSPGYVKTPIFQKKENPMKSEIPQKEGGGAAGGGGFKKRRGNRSMEVNDSDWENLRSFQTTRIEDREGIVGELDSIRTNLNKITDKNYNDIKVKIMDLIERIIKNESNSSEDISKVSHTIFEIASTNRFYSKMYADLYTEIVNKYEIMKNSLNESLDKFSELFNEIEYVDSSVDYDKFCKMNKDNEKRKAIGLFFLNLTINGVIPNIKIISITRNLLANMYSYISQENKKNEVDELSENISLLYKKEFYDDEDEKNEYELIEGYTITEIIERIANSKAKDYKSLTNKTVFKFMDLIDM